jgi:AAA domain
LATITLLNQKGGVGKTSTCHHLAGTLALLGRRLLLVDNDPQSSLTQGLWGPSVALGVDPAETVAAVYAGEAVADRIIKPAGIAAVDLVPGSVHSTRHNVPVPYEADWDAQTCLRSWSRPGRRADIFRLSGSPKRVRWNRRATAAPVARKEDDPMATGLTPKKLGSEKPAAKKVSAKKAAPSMKATANGPAASAEAKAATKAKKRLPAATIRALAELEAGELNRYADADEMLRELCHERGRREATRSPGKTASAIRGRIVKPDQANLNPEIARTILKIDFAPKDHRRVDELSAKARKGKLTPGERAELEEYVRVDLKLTVLRSKARLSLKRANPSP